MKYRFTTENSNFDNLEIDSPKIEIVGLKYGNPSLHANPDFINKVIGLDVYLTTDNVTYCHALKKIKVESMELKDGLLLNSQVLTALNEQFGVK